MDNANLLVQLRDIHLPKDLSTWPWAPGWYILIFILFTLILFLFYCFKLAHGKQRVKKEALQLLQKYYEDYLREKNSTQTCMMLSMLLKRVALVYFPRVEVARLQGIHWLNFLNNTGRVNFSSVAEALLEVPFCNKTSVDSLEPFFQCTKQWIKDRGKPCSH